MFILKIWNRSKDIKGSIPGEEVKMTKTGYFCMAAKLILIICFFLISCQSDGVLKTKTIYELFPGYAGWAPLRRPSSAWTAGTVLEYKNGGIEDLGNVFTIYPFNKNDYHGECFPQDVYKPIEKHEIAEMLFDNKFSYGFSVSATIGRKDEEIVKGSISLNPGFESDQPPKQKTESDQPPKQKTESDQPPKQKTESDQPPQHETLYKIEKAHEEGVNYLKLERYVMEHFSDMPTYCQVLLENPDRAIVNKVFVVTKGTFELRDNMGAKIDFSSPKFKKIADAAVKAGFKVEKSEKISFSEDGPPIPVAVRWKRFDEAIEHNRLYIYTFNANDRN